MATGPAKRVLGVPAVRFQGFKSDRMSRKTLWRNAVSEAVSLHQDQALSTTMVLLRCLGPTGFLLREEPETRVLRVFLGDPHTCTCPEFVREQDLCKHICWVLLRKFRLPREHNYSFQRGLVERQILEVLDGLHQPEAHRTESDPSAASRSPSQAVTGREAGSVCRKAIQAQDVCPICQEELLQKKEPVSYCRFGCGNNVHITCMKVWAEHQDLSARTGMVTCPLCREGFSSVKLLQEQQKNAATLFSSAEREKPDRHLGVACRTCHTCPVTGTCFKCTVCRYFYLCEDCVKKSCHPQHPLAARTKRKEMWRLVDEPKEATSATNSSRVVAPDPLPERMLGRLRVLKVRPGSRLLDAGQQCRICLQDFSLGQSVRSLPCRHKFHADCVDEILKKSNSCPLDGYVIFSPEPPRVSDSQSKAAHADFEGLSVPGVALWLFVK